MSNQRQRWGGGGYRLFCSRTVPGMMGASWSGPGMPGVERSAPKLSGVCFGEVDTKDAPACNAQPVASSTQVAVLPSLPVQREQVAARLRVGRGAGSSLSSWRCVTFGLQSAAQSPYPAGWSSGGGRE